MCPSLPSNRALLDQFFATGAIQLNRTSLFDKAPPPLPEKVNWDKVEGMLLGIAIGDALGNTTESISAEERRHFYLGDIADYFYGSSLGHRSGDWHPDPVYGRGVPSDDTQLSFWLLEQLLADQGLVPENVARLFVERGPEIVGLGSVVSRFLANARAHGGSWQTWAPSEEAAGNGALMRIAPIVVPHLRTRSAELWVDTALAARITHNDSSSLSSCLALVHLIWQCLRRTSPPPAEWWLEEYLRLAGPLECQVYSPREEIRGIASFRGRVVDLLEQHVRPAFARGVSTREACGRHGWGSGAYLLETIPSVLYILMRHGHSFEEGIIRAVNDTRDNDTIAAIVGAVLGALHGKRAIPPRWITNLPGRTRIGDEGQVFRLIEAAKERWG